MDLGCMDQGNISAEDRRTEYESHRAEAKQFMKDEYGFEQVDFLPELEKRAKHSKYYFRQILIAEQHFSEAIYILCKMVNEDGFPLPLCEKFVEEFSTGAKMEIFEARMPKGLIDYACGMVDRILSLEAAAGFHEDICVCSIELHVASGRPQKKFLNECIHRYPFNAYFFAMRSRLMNHSQRYRQGLTDINTAIKLNPSNSQHLYHRANMMLELFPEVLPESTIEAFEEFLLRSPIDDPHVSSSYYKISVIYGRMSLICRFFGDETGAQICAVQAADYLEMVADVVFSR